MLPSPLLLDPSAVLRFVFSALLVLSGALFLVRRAASRYFFVGDDCSPFASAAEDDRRVAMSIGGAAREGGGGACAACGNPGRKTCSRCKGVRYCSEACQTRHWDADHKSKCKKTRTSNDVSPSDIYRRRKSSGFSSICLVPAHGTCKVLQEPKKILFPYDEFLKLFNWDKPGFPPCGLLNCGNSCFANVVLQSLACTRPLTAYLLERDHNSECVRKHKDWCFLCELQVHIRRASASSLPFSPINILSRLPNIGGNLGYGRQEDAHEFMRFAIDTMQSICLDEYGGEKALDPSSRETTLIQHIFGGHLQSQVICTKCNTISNRYENMMDLTVEIQGDAESLEECLDQFTIKEWLDGDNMYKCDGCNDYVKAWKRLTIHQAPNILTIALKRFQSGRFGKLNKRVIFPENLDLTPYMSSQSDGNDQYTLYAVVVHVDMLNASFFGHYICYTKDYSGQWYRIDDCKVMTVEVEEVLSQGAYMLLYSRKFPRPGSFIKSMEDARKTHSTEVDSVLPSPSKGNNHIGVSACGPTGIGSQSNVSPTKRANDGSVLLAARCENELIMESDTENVPPSVHIDDPKLSSSGSENLSEKGDILPVNPMQSDSFPSVMVSSSETQEMDCQEIHDNLDADCCLESNRLFCDTKKFTPYGPCFPKDVDTEMSEATSASITMSVPAEQALDDLPPKLKQTEAVLHPTNSVVTDSEAKVLESSPENGSSRRPKPMFSRGFLDGPARRKPALPKGKAEVEVSRAVTLRNANGCSNGYSVTDASQLDICANDARLSSYTGSAKDSVCRSDFAFISKAFPNGKQVNEENIVNDDSHHSRKADCSLPSDLASPCQNGNEIISLDDEKQVSLEELAGSERETAENLSRQSDHVHNASSNTLSEEGKCTSSRTDFTFMSRGFLNVSHKKQSKPKIARKDLDKMGHPCAAVSSRSINGLAPGENGTLASQDTPHPSEIQSCTRLKN